MNKPDGSSSGSNASVVILIALLVLGLPCLAAVALGAMGLYWSVQIVPPRAAPQPVVVMPSQPAMPLELRPLDPAAEIGAEPVEEVSGIPSTPPADPVPQAP